MSMGLNPIFNYIVNKSAQVEIKDSSFFDEYFRLLTDPYQFGYNTLVQLKSNSTYKSCLCYLLILALELEQFKMPFNRIQELRSIICRCINVAPEQARDRAYLTLKYQLLSIRDPFVDQSKKTQQLPEQSKIQPNHLTPLSECKALNQILKEEKSRPDESILFSEKKQSTNERKQIQEKVPISQEKIKNIDEDQSKQEKKNQSNLTQKSLFSSPPLCKPQQIVIKKKSGQIRQINDAQIQNQQSSIVCLSKRHYIEIEQKEKKNQKPQPNYFSQQNSNLSNVSDQILIKNEKNAITKEITVSSITNMPLQQKSKTLQSQEINNQDKVSVKEIIVPQLIIIPVQSEEIEKQKLNDQDQIPITSNQHTENECTSGLVTQYQQSGQQQQQLEIIDINQELQPIITEKIDSQSRSESLITTETKEVRQQEIIIVKQDQVPSIFAKHEGNEVTSKLITQLPELDQQYLQLEMININQELPIAITVNISNQLKLQPLTNFAEVGGINQQELITKQQRLQTSITQNLNQNESQQLIQQQRDTHCANQNSQNNYLVNKNHQDECIIQTKQL